MHPAQIGCHIATVRKKFGATSDFVYFRLVNQKLGSCRRVWVASSSGQPANPSYGDCPDVCRAHGAVARTDDGNGDGPRGHRPVLTYVLAGRPRPARDERPVLLIVSRHHAGLLVPALNVDSQRSQPSRMPWGRFQRFVARNIPKVHTLHSYPKQHFAS